MAEEQSGESVVIERSVGKVKIRATADLAGPFGVQYLRILQQFDVIEIIERTHQIRLVNAYPANLGDRRLWGLMSTFMGLEI